MVRAEQSRTLNQEDVGLIPTVYWMDVSLASYYIERKDNKGSQMGHTKKKYFIGKKKKKKLVELSQENNYVQLMLISTKAFFLSFF